MSTSRLGTVLRLRAIEERKALGELGRARIARQDAAASLDRQRVAYADRPLATSVRGPTDRGPSSMATARFRGHALAGLGAHERVLDATHALADAESAVGAAQDAWSAASIRHRSVERLDERIRMALAAEARKAADRALDELVVTRHGGKR